MTWPLVPLGRVLAHRKHFIQIDDSTQYKRCRVQLYGKGIVLRDIVAGAELRTKKQQVCRPGEFLVAEIDAKLGGFGVIPRDLDGAIVSSHYFLFTIDESNLNSALLAYLCRTSIIVDQVAAKGSTNYAAIRPAHVLEYRIPLPPLPEQQRIVRLLDAAEELRRLREQADRRTADLVPALFHEMFGGEQWPVVPVAEAGEVQLGRQRAPQYQTGRYTRPYVRVANVFEDRIDVSDLLSMDFDSADFQAYRLEHGDILLTEGQSTELVGRPAMWRDEVPDCCFQNTLIRFRATPGKTDPHFALGVFLAYFRSGEFAKLSAKTTSVAHLGAGRFAKMPFPMPPLSLQRDFARRFDEIRLIETKQAESRRRLDDLFQSLLHRAFRGEL